MAISIWFGSFAYLIIAVQVANGFPSFYIDREYKAKNPDYVGRFFKGNLLYFALVFLGVGLLVLAPYTGYPRITILLGGIFPLFAAIKTRQYLKHEVGYPSPFMSSFFTHSPSIRALFDRSPMLLFDVWTVVLSIGFASMNYFTL